MVGGLMDQEDHWVLSVAGMAAGTGGGCGGQGPSVCGHCGDFEIFFDETESHGAGG